MRATIHAAVDPLTAAVHASIDGLAAAIHTPIDAIALAVEALGSNVAASGFGAGTCAVQASIGDIAAMVETPFDAVAAVVEALLDSIASRVETLGAGGVVGKGLAACRSDCKSNYQNSVSHFRSPRIHPILEDYNASVT